MGFEALLGEVLLSVAVHFIHIVVINTLWIFNFKMYHGSKHK